MRMGPFANRSEYRRRHFTCREKRAMNTVQHYVSGDVWAGASDRFGDVYNPATGAV